MSPSGIPGVVKRPAVPPPVRVRRNINSLAIGDPIVTFYGRAIGAMKAKLIGDSASWRFQGAIHDYPFPDTTFNDRRIDPANPATAGRDPFATPGDALPGDRGTFWRQCQHRSWFFMPWHRMYLHHFERIVMAEVAALGGPTDWALPYWNWDARDGDGRLPEAFRSATLADGSTNHLFVRERRDDPGRNANAGDPIADADQMDKRLFNCLRPTVFEGNGQFGGPPVRRHGGQGPPETIPPALNGSGRIEGTPHGSLHTATGGVGFMSRFTQAALDPIFWLHHCNIDRLWEVWRRMRAGQTPAPDPTDVAWLDASFQFRDASKASVTMRPREVLITTAAPLSYEYDNTTSPIASP